MHVVGGIHQVDGVIGGPTLIVNEDGATLVDTGYPGYEEATFALLESLGRDRGSLRSVLVTHSDGDHIGCLPAIVAATGAVVHASAPEIEVIEGRRAAKNGRTVDLPVTVDRIVADGDVLPLHGGIRVIGTPGHTPGHVAYLVEAHNLLIAGDSLNANDAGSVFGASPQFSLDLEEARASVLKLADLAPDSICFGHGLPVVGDAAERLRALVASLRVRGSGSLTRSTRR